MKEAALQLALVCRGGESYLSLTCRMLLIVGGDMSCREGGQEFMAGEQVLAIPEHRWAMFTLPTRPCPFGDLVVH